MSPATLSVPGNTRSAKPAQIRAMPAAEIRARRDELVTLLAEAVEGNASVGYLLPVDRGLLARFWDEVADDVDGGTRTCLVALRDGAIAGSVQLAPCTKPNQPHRADVQKLLVRPSLRRQGLGAALMRAAEDAARAQRRVLLVLDTRTGSDADRQYRRWGWSAVGVVPGYAYDPDGALGDCTFYFKRLA
jgi:GNAT superfamily N-acetyltransferase